MTSKLALGAGCVFAALATSAQGGITDPCLDITASSSLGTATLRIRESMGEWRGDTWSMLAGESIQLVDTTTGQRIAEIRELFVEFIEDPQVTVNFTAVAGPVVTAFSFSSGVLSFPTINPSTALATAGVTVTDNDSDGAVFTGTMGGDGFRALYNDTVVFDTLLATYAVPADDSLTQNERSPGSGQTAIGSTFNMSSNWDFTLSANDQVGGTSLFRIVPAPGAVALFGLAGLTAARRRR
jgi:hypothetical protein